jgi:LacI family transcriptional regulator, repressor for deo operon, udp, cdd, tsx, nupC, and nupG
MKDDGKEDLNTPTGNAVTIRDIANRAGVSVGTVSRALNNQTGLSAETRQRIHDAAKDLDYDASNLRQNKLRRISFVTARSLALAINPFYTPVLHGVEQACREQEIALSYASLTLNDRAAEILRRHESDALMLVGYFDQRIFDRVAAIGLPMVLIDYFVPGFASVHIDNLSGMKQVMAHLIEGGHRRIAFIGGPQHYSIQQRLYGYKLALYEAGIPADPLLEVMPNPIYTEASTRDALLGLLKRDKLPDAIFAFNDQTALWAMRACQKAGFRIPEDIRMVGFDDIEISAYANPPLTSVRVNKEALGQKGLQCLIERNCGADVLEVMPVELIVRESSTVRHSS